MESRNQRITALAALALAAAALQIPLWGWEVEDAAIDLAYARNLAHGYGLVAQVGGERIEGFSNPLWVAVLAVTDRLGIDGFTSTRWLGLLFGVAAVPAVYAAMRPVAARLPGAPLAAAAAFALYAPQAIWAQSGLENALFSLLLAIGCARVAADDDLDALGPLAFLGVALTRPEGVMYGLIGAGAALASAVSWPSAARRLGMWILLFAVPVAGSELCRVLYFGQELPATFHAKLASPRPLDGTSRGWTQLFAFARETGTVAVLPLAAVGASGATEWRWVSGLVCAALLGLAALTGSVWFVLLVLIGLPLAALGQKPQIVLAAALVCVGCAFHVGADGDWMRGYRWMAMVAVPGAMLVGAGIAEIAKRFDEVKIPIAIAASLAAIPQALYIAKYAREPEVSPAAVVERLDHWLSVARRLQLDRRIRIVDHDMGGMLFFGADRAFVRDTKGLVDLPFALYGPERSVVEHELFPGGVAAFDFAHAHGNTRAAIGGLPEFRAQFVEIEGYGRGHSHKGQFVRRALFLDQGWDGPVMPITFAGGVRLHGVYSPSPEVGPGAGLYVELGVDRVGDGARPAAFRMLAFLTPVGGREIVASWDLPPAYDWVDVGAWRPGEVFHGRFSLPVPQDLAEGSYDLGLVVLDADGAVLPAQAATLPSVVPALPTYANGEVRIPGLVTIVSREEMGRLALADKAGALAAAAGDRCEDAERAWDLALRHRTRSADWRRANRPPVARAIAACFARRAGAGSFDGDDLLDRVHELERARAWDPTEPATWTNASRVGASAHGRAVATEDPIVRFQWAEAAVRADPRRSWDRRLAERTRRSWLNPR